MRWRLSSQSCVRPGYRTAPVAGPFAHQKEGFCHDAAAHNLNRCHLSLVTSVEDTIAAPHLSDEEKTEEALFMAMTEAGIDLELIYA